jgi:hypothetical protein
MDIIQAVLDSADSAVVIWELIKSLAGDGGKEEEPESDGEGAGSSTDDGDCLQSTSFDGTVSIASCSQNGTFWIQVPHSNGSYLINRYEYDHGNKGQVLSVVNDSNGKDLILDSEGSGWQTWTWSTFFIENSPELTGAAGRS